MPSPPSAPLPPVGPYQLLGELGRGAMGVVYRAFDPALGRQVALKVVLGGGRPERLLREGQVTAALDHPGIVRVHAAGALPDGRPYLAYELIEAARTLEEVLPALPLSDRLRRVRDAARALGYAHARGVVHRDVKPSNVLVSAAGEVKVADFGLAVANDLERLTQTGALVGTPAYMAPEMLFPEVGPVGPPADVWALGVVLHEALSGELPFAGVGFVELASAIRRGLRARLPREVSRDAAAVCARALALAPEARYPDGEALARDLDAVLRGERPTAARGGRGGALRVAALALLACAAVAGVAWGARGPRATSAPRALERPAVETAPGPVRGEAPPDPAAAWAAVEGELDRVRQHAACRAWLARFPEHGLAPRARERLRRLAREPLARLAHFEPQERKNLRLVVAFAADGAPLTTSHDGAVARWDGSPLREVLRRRVGEPGGVRQMLVLGEAVLLSGGWGVRAVASLAEGAPLLRWKPSRQADLGAAAASPDGRLVAAALLPSEVVLLGRDDLAPRASLPCHGTLKVLAFLPDGRLLASSETSDADLHRDTGFLAVWSVAGGAPQRLRERPLESAATALAVLPPGGPASFALGDDVGRLRLFDGAGEVVGELLAAGELAAARPAWQHQGAHPGVVRGAVASPDGAYLYSIGYAAEAAQPQGELAVWELATRRQVRAVSLGASEARSIALSPDGGTLLVGHEDGTATLWVAGPLAR